MRKILETIFLISIVVTLSNGDKVEIPDSDCEMTRGGWFGTTQMTSFSAVCDYENNISINEYARFNTKDIVSIVRKSE